MLSTPFVSPRTDVFRPMRPKNARKTMDHQYFCTRQLWTRWIENDSTLPRCVHVTCGARCKPCFRRFVAGSVSRRQEELSSTIEKATLEYKESLRWGTAEQQGPRESMEDAVHVVENGRCGFFFASKAFRAIYVVIHVVVYKV
jgi:hypothetical protein